MFKNLKKKIEQQGGTVPDVEKVLSPVSSPSGDRRDSNSVGAPHSSLTRGSRGYESDTGLITPPSPRPIPEETVSSSKEEIVALLSKRTDQYRKLEKKITEYAAMIKDKNKQIEQLEYTLEKQKEDTEKKILEINEQNQSARNTMSEGFTLALQKKDEEKNDLLAKVKEFEEFKEKIFKKEEEKDEIHELANQEMAKIKHMLLNTQETLSVREKELQLKTTALQTAKENATEQEKRILYLESQLYHSRDECEKLNAESLGTSKILESLKHDKDELLEKIIHLEEEIVQKKNCISTIESTKTELEGNYGTLEHSFESFKNKNKQLLSEKDDHISQLQDRVKMLEQRLQDHNLGGDERVQALVAERDSLEHKLSETLQQLSDIKSTWSDKITHLEEQISHLNKKIVEDNEELLQSEKTLESTRDQFNAQIEHLQTKLDAAEKHSKENTDLLEEKILQFKKEKEALEESFNKSHMENIDLETQLRSKITSLESQIMSLEEKTEGQSSLAAHKIKTLEEENQESLDKLLQYEKQVDELEKQINDLKGQCFASDDKQSSLQTLLDEREKKITELSQKVTQLESRLSELMDSADTSKQLIKEQQTNMRSCEKERDELMLRNAELSQQLTSLNKQKTEEIKDFSHQLQEKDIEKDGLQQQLLGKDQEIKDLHHQVLQAEQEKEEMRQEQALSQETCSTVTNLQKTVEDLEEQLNEKNRSLKKQEQRLADLKKTLQRELKVQALPNDEPMLMAAGSSSPSQPHRFQRVSPPIGEDSNNLGALGKFSDFVNSAENIPSLHGLGAPNSYNNGVHESSDFYSLQNNSNKMNKSQECENSCPISDVNFQYLKHVVLKFMLSRESEAIQLTKAIGTLLKFSKDEQKLIKETLEYKMSWFGTKPSTGKGQKNRVIPPTL